MEPVSLTAAAIATLVITKAFEKTGEIIGEKAWDEGEKLLVLLKRKEPSTAKVIEQAKTQPLDYSQAYLIGQRVEEAANKDPEIAQAVEAVANEAQPQLTNTIIENWQGINIKGGINTISGNTLNF
ncbi:hypothetical protein PQG02_29125 [Nostoc sp. UHCC 0926]|uniref:hypothetical protein n=1 Tax=unclassified Nostoc TaxID=2593658 RepID=UPI002362B358|nr:hypothetical protein [Nostoc sp. UHCC 0926]WDD32664.1 hypothetical protein PQG02_29125 [Nostoc sp. UHCC 0926]